MTKDLKPYEIPKNYWDFLHEDSPKTPMETIKEQINKGIPVRLFNTKTQEASIIVDVLPTDAPLIENTPPTKLPPLIEHDKDDN